MTSVSLSMLGSFPDHMGDEVPAEWAMGFFFAIRRSLAKKWNCRWDENLVSYAYNEDLDFTYSYYKASKREGYYCRYFKDVHVKHLASKEYRIPSVKKIRMFVLHRYYLGHKHHMGWLSTLIMTHTNFCFFVRNVFKRERPAEILKAIIIYFRHKRIIDRGRIEPYI